MPPRKLTLTFTALTNTFQVSINRDTICVSNLTEQKCKIAKRVCNTDDNKTLTMEQIILKTIDNLTHEMMQGRHSAATDIFIGDPVTICTQTRTMIPFFKRRQEFTKYVKPHVLSELVGCMLAILDNMPWVHNMCHASTIIFTENHVNNK